MENKENINNSSFNDIDAIFEVFGDTYKEHRERADKERQKLNEYIEKRAQAEERTARKRRENIENIRKYQQVQNKSIGRNKKVEDRGRRKHTEIDLTKLQRKVAITLLTIASVVALSVPIGIKVEPTIKNMIQTRENIINSTNYEIEKARKTLDFYDLAGTDMQTGKFVVKENSVTDYRKLGIICNAGNTDKQQAVYIYKLVLPDSEFAKFIKSVSYSDGLHYYTSFEQFLNINGYYMQGTNIPSDKVFYNKMEAIISKKADEILNEKKYYAGDGVYSIGDYLEETNKGKGGK